MDKIPLDRFREKNYRFENEPKSWKSKTGEVPAIAELKGGESDPSRSPGMKRKFSLRGGPTRDLCYA